MWLWGTPMAFPMNETFPLPSVPIVPLPLLWFCIYFYILIWLCFIVLWCHHWALIAFSDSSVPPSVIFLSTFTLSGKQITLMSDMLRCLFIGLYSSWRRWPFSSFSNGKDPSAFSPSTPQSALKEWMFQIRTQRWNCAESNRLLSAFVDVALPGQGEDGDANPSSYALDNDEPN